MFQDKLTREIAAAAAQIKTEPPKNEVNTKSVEGAVMSIMTNEELKGNQHKIDANKNGKIDSHDFKLLRAKKGKTVEEGIKGAGVGAAVGSVAGGPVGAAIGGALGHVAGEVLSSAKNKTKAMYRIAKGPSMADSKMKREEVEQLDELMGKSKLPAIAAYHKEKGAEAKGKMETIRSGNTKLPVPKSTSAKIFSKDAEAKYHSTQEKRANALMKKEETEQLDELMGKSKLPAIAAYHKEKGAEAKGKMETIRNTNTTVPVPKQKSAKIFAKDAEAKYHSTQEKRAKALMKKEEVEPVEEGFGDLVKGIKRVVAGKKSPSAVRDAHLAKATFSSDPKVKEREGRRYDKVDNFMMKKEETELDEAFPTVADAKKRMAAKESGFEKKKISTGTVYSRKYKAEPEENDEAPKKKAKTMKEMLEIYSNGGAEALVENLMIEEPSQDEYKKEVEVAHAKAEGKIRNDKGIAKPATQGVKMEEVEQIEELSKDTYKNYLKKSEGEVKKALGRRNSGNNVVGEPVGKHIASTSRYAEPNTERRGSNTGKAQMHAIRKLNKEELEQIEEESTYKLGRAAAETKDFPIKHNGEHVGRLEFHASAGKLHHRVSSVKGVPHEKFIGHPDRSSMIDSHVKKHEAEARQHFAKKLKEGVEIEVLDADEINGVQIDNIEERSLTDTEMNKREEIVKSMKKGIQGFKDRYGDRAKEVMYATATARAKKD